MKKILCVLVFVLIAGMVISDCSNPANMDSNPENMSNVNADSSEFNEDSLTSELLALGQLQNAILDSCSKEKNWIRYAETLMEYGPRIDEIRAHMVGLDRYPHEKEPCRYIPFYSQEQISRIRSAGREDLAERYIGINEAKQLLCN